MPMKMPRTTKTPPASSSETDWDKLDEMEPDPAQAEQMLNLPSVPRSATPSGPWTEAELKAAGVPDSLRPMAHLYGSLQELMADYPDAR
jgi:hypothetical protein